MPPRKKVNATKKEIIQIAMRMFLENGFTDTSVKSISNELDISTGNLTFHFPTKEHLLAVLVELLCSFQSHMIEVALNEGSSSMMAMCLELAAIASICDSNAVAKDFYISAYTHPMTLEIIRHNDRERARRIFSCPGWTDREYTEAETLVSGIEYGTLMTTPSAGPLSVRVAGALHVILRIYGVSEDYRDMMIGRVLEMDYRSLGKRFLSEFNDYVRQISEEHLEQLLRK